MPTEVCCLYATAPFMQPADISQALALLTEGNCGYVFPVTAYSLPVQRAVRLASGNRVQMANPEHYNTRSQDLETQYHDVGPVLLGHGKSVARPVCQYFPQMRVRSCFPATGYKTSTHWTTGTGQRSFSACSRPHNPAPTSSRFFSKNPHQISRHAFQQITECTASGSKPHVFRGLRSRVCNYRFYIVSNCRASCCPVHARNEARTAPRGFLPPAV